MGLKILRKSSRPTVQPEPLYKQRIQALLRKNHPLFEFQIERMDCKTTIDFSVQARKCTLNGLELLPGRPFLFCTFAGFWFDREMANTQHFSVHTQFKYFEQYLFKCVSKFISEVLGRENLESCQDFNLLNDDIVDWSAVTDYFALLAEGLPMLVPMAGEADGILNLALAPAEGLQVEGFSKVYGATACRFNKQELGAEIEKYAQDKGSEAANEKLKQYILNLMTDALYGMEWVSDAQQSD